jgi:hypothetical protein
LEYSQPSCDRCSLELQSSKKSWPIFFTRYVAVVAFRR